MSSGYPATHILIVDFALGQVELAELGLLELETEILHWRVARNETLAFGENCAESAFARLVVDVMQMVRNHQIVILQERRVEVLREPLHAPEGELLHVHHLPHVRVCDYLQPAPGKNLPSPPK